jgi:hypothetical protein
MLLKKFYRTVVGMLLVSSFVTTSLIAGTASRATAVTPAEAAESGNAVAAPAAQQPNEVTDEHKAALQEIVHSITQMLSPEDQKSFHEMSEDHKHAFVVFCATTLRVLTAQSEAQAKIPEKMVPFLQFPSSLKRHLTYFPITALVTAIGGLVVLAQGMKSATQEVTPKILTGVLGMGLWFVSAYTWLGAKAINNQIEQIEEKAVHFSENDLMPLGVMLKRNQQLQIQMVTSSILRQVRSLSVEEVRAAIAAQQKAFAKAAENQAQEK